MMSRNLFLIVLSFTLLFPQLSQDARMLGLNGAYTTVARGYQCVGVNPANLMYSNIFSINLLTFNLGSGNNTLSLDVINELNGADLENPNAEVYFPKENLSYIFDDDGIIISTDLAMPLPLLNFSFKNYAFTSTPKLYTKFGLPSGFVDLLFYGNEIGRDLSIDLPLDVMAVQETGFTYAFSNQDFTFGVTAKYLLGYFYSTFESVDSSYFRTDSTAFTGQGSFLMKQAIGGNGFDLDVGMLSPEFDNGIQLGISITNLVGSIKWTQDHFLRSAIDATIQESIPDEYFLRQNEFYYYQLDIDSMNAVNLSAKPINEMISGQGYKVIKVDDLSFFNLNQSDTLVITLPNENGYLIPSADISTATLNSLSSEPMRTNYPAIFRLGVSKNYEEGVIIMADLSTGFSDDLGGFDSWRIAFATEITHYPIITFRSGLAFGGSYGRSMSLGAGFKAGPVFLDLGMAYRDGLSMNAMKGLDFSITASIR
jgi:hypothetical protein